jgi:high affinity Mn2+ porin
MGNYNMATALDSAHRDLSYTRGDAARSKFGIGVNIEQEVNADCGIFARVSWNDGTNETWAFTEIDQSFSLGTSIKGTAWKRTDDILGLAVVVNGISAPHQNYLKAGGKGFMIGDGNLNYAPEMIGEFFYNILLHEDHFWLTPHYQFIVNPAYNKDRGPANILGLRLHSEF